MHGTTARRRTSLARVASLVVAVLAAVGCAGGGDPPDEEATPRAPSTVSTLPARPCEVDDGTGADLEPLLTDRLPRGYTIAPLAAEEAGPTDLELAADHVGGDPYEVEVLTAGRFRRGHQRHFYGPDDGDGGGDLRIHLYEFCHPDGAGTYLRHTTDRLVSPLWGSVEIDVAGLPEGGVALLQQAPAGDESFVAILRAAGRFYVEVGAWDHLSEDAPLAVLATRALDLAEAQVDALSMNTPE